MNLQQLRELAQNAVDCTNKNPFSERLQLVPVVQVCSDKFVCTFPVRFKYLGVNRRGQHVYNLDAQGIIHALNRMVEFDL